MQFTFYFEPCTILVIMSSRGYQYSYGYLYTSSLSQISLTMPWKKARKLIKEDPRYKAFGDSDNVNQRYTRHTHIVFTHEHFIIPYVACTIIIWFLFFLFSFRAESVNMTSFYETP